MIEIIKHGNLSFKKKCPFCDCKFRYTASDIQFVEIKGSELKAEFVDCPECTFRIPLNNPETT